MIEGYIYHLVENTLKKENAKEIITKKISWYEMELKHRQDIIDKATEYINKNGIIDLNGYDLLNILQGVDKE